VSGVVWLIVEFISWFLAVTYITQRNCISIEVKWALFCVGNIITVKPYIFLSICMNWQLVCWVILSSRESKGNDSRFISRLILFLCISSVPINFEALFQRFRSASRKHSYCIGSASFSMDFFLICTKKKQ
jgi:hypothetical protein